MAVNMWLPYHFQSQSAFFEDQTNQPTDESMLGRRCCFTSFGNRRENRDLRVEGILVSV